MTRKYGDVYTTGEVARLCRVATRTVTTWIDRGYLHGYRIPGSQDRRVSREELARFVREYGIEHAIADVDAGAGANSGARSLARDGPTVLVVSADPALAEGLRAVGGMAVSAACDVFGAGCAADAIRPRAVVVDLDLGRLDARTIAVHARRRWPGIAIVAVRADPHATTNGDAGLYDESLATANTDTLGGMVLRLMRRPMPAPSGVPTA